MNNKQLNLIRDFCKKYYEGVSDYHDWNHILLVIKSSHLLSKEFRKINKNTLIASCYIHDIGRKYKDEGHPQKSIQIAKPFLKKIGVNEEDIAIIIDSVGNHDKDRILSARTVEAKILFDADKLQILSVFGFLRVSYWLTAERHMGMNQVVDFLWKYINEVKEKYIQTKTAKKIVDSEYKKIKAIVESFKTWQKV
jgi:HD superfamily phosphodiesterase